MKKFTKLAISVICSLILIVFLWKSMGIDGNSVVYPMIFFATVYFFNALLKDMNIKKCIFCGSISVVFGGIEAVVKPMDIYGYFPGIEWSIILQFFGYVIITFFSTNIIFDIFSKGVQNVLKKNKEYRFINNRKLMFFVDMVLIFVAWLPYFLRYYPGLLTSDSCDQMEQLLGITGFSNHHPIFHTLTISVFVNIGNGIFHDINVAVAIYTVAQMLIMATIFSFVIRYLYKKDVHVLIRTGVLLFYMFYPINALFSITMWKDILFAGIVPVFVIACNEFINNSENYAKSWKCNISFLIIAVLTALLRNNGIYVVLLTLCVLFILSIKNWKRAAMLFLSIIVIYFGIKSAIFSIFNVEKGPMREMLSIPLQQIARVEKNHREELDEETIANINKVFLVEEIGNKYNSRISDAVKIEFNEEFFKNNKGEFIKIWCSLLTKYPRDYIESFIMNSYGYYYPEASYWVANRTMNKNRIGLKQTPIIEGKMVSKIDSLIEKREIPISSMFFSIGMAVWIIFICCAYKIYDKDKKSVVMYIPIFVLWLTLIASPVFCEYRYAYPMFTTLPIYISLNFKKTVKGE